MLHIETGLPELYIYTLTIHMHYILKTLQLPDNRGPKILAEEIIVKNKFWMEKWNSMAREYGCSFKLKEIGEGDSLLSKLAEARRNTHLTRARLSQSYTKKSNLYNRPK